MQDLEEEALLASSNIEPQTLDLTNTEVLYLKTRSAMKEHRESVEYPHLRPSTYSCSPKPNT